MWWGIDYLEHEEFIGFMITASCLGAGLLMLLITQVKPWFSVPIDILVADTETGFQVVMRESRFTSGGRAIVAACIIGLTGLSFRCVLFRTRKVWADVRVATSRIITTLFVLMLFYPWATMTWDIRLATHAAWLQDQHYNLTWLGGDVYNNTEGRDDIAKSAMMFSTNALRTGVYALPDSRVGGLRLSSLSFVLEWLGYGMAFTQFEGQGWLFGLAACPVIYLGLLRCQKFTGPVAHESTRTFAVPALAAVILLVAAIVPPLKCGKQLDLARLDHARGDYASSLDHLRRAGSWLPVMREHSQYVAQEGYLLMALGHNDSPSARLVQGVEMESRGMLAEAEETFFEVLDRGENQPAWQWDGVTREAYRALIRAGIEDFNSGQTIRCHELFRVLMARCRNNLKVAVAMQYAALRHNEPAECTELVNRVYTIYQGFDALDSKGVKSLVQANAARCHFLSNNENEVAKHFIGTVRP